MVLAARGVEALELAAKTLSQETGRRVIGVPTDTGDDDSVRALVQRTVDELGGVDILVNAAATPWSAGKPSDFASTTDDVVRGELEIKVLGYLRTARAVAPHLVEQGWGRIINISGLNARRTGSVFGSIRNVSVAAMSKNLADELGPQGTNVTVVHPWLTETEGIQNMIRNGAAAKGVAESEFRKGLAADVSIGRLVQPVEVARVVTFLASPLSVAINGDAIAAGGGILGPIFY